ncbi:NADH-quinone oxidoreductase subunit B family protein [Desulfobulbus propionicus]|jgi:Ni,Fe-hydrogenase III small subunit/Pyruvate/2-oxoacid:ferredoxin oxidoreductase delta subunit
MLKVIRNRLEQGCRTTAYPKKPVQLYSRFRGLPTINQDCDPAIVRQCAELCPQEAILVEEKKIDLGRCTFCGECAQVGDGAFVQFSSSFELAAANRQDLITDGSLPDLAAHSSAHFKKLFGRSLQLRQVSAGGCNACEADINVLNTPFFDLSRFGIDFVASPRHADGIHVTGPITRNMKTALLATYAAVPSPKVVIASGCCAISGGPFYGSKEIIGDLASILPVDLFIPGCPPHPLTTLHALLAFFKA